MNKNPTSLLQLLLRDRLTLLLLSVLHIMQTKLVERGGRRSKTRCTFGSIGACELFIAQYHSRSLSLVLRIFQLLFNSSNRITMCYFLLITTVHMVIFSIYTDDPKPVWMQLLQNI